MESMNEHFSIVAQSYRRLRTTDLEPIFYIGDQLKELQKIKAADIGCGSGRYDLRLLQYFRSRLFLHCIDSNNKMLEQLEEYLTQHNLRSFQVIQATARNLPIQDKSLDCVFTFNAIHHFEVLEFLIEASRVLEDGGYLFIYTRLRSQNGRSVWGKYFPLFNQKENRLYELDELYDVIKKIPRLEIQSVELFKYQRVSHLDWLVKQARYHHYSTFYLYTNSEFEESLTEFKQNLERQFEDLNKISWLDENILLVIRKRTSYLLGRGLGQ